MIVETPKKSAVKYTFDSATGLFVLKRAFEEVGRGGRAEAVRAIKKASEEFRQSSSRERKP
jgi:hypothetical protein